VSSESSNILQFTTYDWALVVAYLLFLLYLGLRDSRRGRSSAEEFILGGRMLSLPGFVAALVTTWYGGILGVGEFSYMYGLANWVVFGAPYYVFALLFAFVFAKRVRSAGMYSIPDMLYHTYDRKTGFLGSVLVYFNSSPAPYVLMLAVLVQVVTAWPLWVCLVSGSAVSVLYIFLGGFRAVVRTELLQFVLMFGGFFLLLAFLVPVYGVADFLPDRLPTEHLSLTGGHSAQYILVWFFIALWTLVAPQFHQFTLSARTPTVARRGILVSVCCWFVLDGITTLSGLYARALLPDLAQASMAYPLLAEEILPPVAKALFFIGMLATVLSTTDGLTFIASLTLGRDVIAKWTGRSDDRAINRYTQYGVLCTAALSICVALLFPSVIELWYIIGTLFIPALLFPLSTAYYPRFAVSPTWTFRVMLSGFLVSFLAFLAGVLNSIDGQAQYPLGVEPMYAGLGMAFLLHFSAMLVERSRE